MKRMLAVGKLTRNASLGRERTSDHPADTPEAILLKELNAFCDAAVENNRGDEYLHLPAIVEAAESSPTAAKEAAERIRRILSNPGTSKPYKQYNAIMVLRILADNPGPTFTRNLDDKFVSTAKSLLRDGRDMGVQQMLRETLESLLVQKFEDPNLAKLVDMWKKEKEKFEKKMGLSAGAWSAPTPNNAFRPSERQDYFSRQHRPKGLPDPSELAARITEANTSANLLGQLVSSTPASEFQDNELLGEFSHRCQSAARSIQAYINATNPAPDEDTMLTLIETNDRLSVSLSKYQRSALAARKTVGARHPLDHQHQQQYQAQEQYEQYHPPPPQQQPQAQQSAPETPQRVRSISQNTNENVVSPLIERKYSIPRLSMPRKALSVFRSSNNNNNLPPPSEHAAQTNSTTHSAAAPASVLAGDVSPLGPAPPIFPSIQPEQLQPPQRRTELGTGSQPPLQPQPQPRQQTNGASSEYQYNSSDYQVENPFADTYATTTTTTAATAGIGEAQRSTNSRDGETSAPENPVVTSSTYVPGADYSLFDNNLPGSKPPGESAVGTK